MLILQPSTPPIRAIRSDQTTLVANSTQTLVFIDSAFVEHLPLLSDINTEMEVVLLEVSRDGIEQITEVLLRHRAVRRLQILTASTPGIMQIGTARLDLSTLEAYSSQFQTWRKVLMPDASILLWGKVAIGTTGMALMGRLSQLTGAIVAVAPKQSLESGNCSDYSDKIDWSEWMDLLD